MAIAPDESVTLEDVGRPEDGAVFDTSHREVAEGAGPDASGREFAPPTVGSETLEVD